MNELEVIDAALAGDPVDPEHAELAELVLLLRDERPVPAPEVAARLDGRLRSAPSPRRRPATRWWAFAPAGGLAVAVVVAVVVGSGGGRGRPMSSSSGVAHVARGVPLSRLAPALTPATSASGAFAPNPTFPGRKQVQSSELYLSTRPSHMEDVAYQVLVIVRRYNGYVNNSTVSSGANGYSQFQLTVPSSSLSPALGDLSTLQYAQVVSRTDNTNDVTDQFNGASNELAEAQALRTSLLKQLQNASTQTQIDALQAQLHDANARIGGAQSTLRSLSRQISYSQISLTVQTGHAAPVPVSGGSFTIGKAAHDAGRVLTVAAGVALIALAGLVPVALVVAAVWWIAELVRRRRREQALDMA